MSGVIDDFSDNEPWMGLYKDYPNVKFIKFQSVEYREYLATAKYLINNVSFPGYFTKRKEQDLCGYLAWNPVKNHRI